MAQVRAITIQQEREEFYGALQNYVATIQCLVEEWKDCEELGLKPEEKRVFVNKNKGKQRTSHGVV